MSEDAVMGTGRGRPRRRRWRRWAALGVVVLIVLGVGAAAADVSLFAAPPLALAAGAAAPVGPLEGAWRTGPGSEAGFRIRQTVLGMSGDVVGRTASVTGGMTVVGTLVTRATFSVDLTTMQAGGKPAPQFALSLGTATYPTATATLTRPIPLGAAFASGRALTTTAAAELMMHGTSRAITVTLTARRDGARIEVVGSIPIAFADWGIAGPAGYGWLGSLADHGAAEWLLVLERA